MQNVIIKNENAIYYACGYSCDNAIYARLGHDSYFITDGRYTTDAHDHLKSTEVIEARDLVEALRKLLKKHRVKKVIIDPQEWSISAFAKLTNKLSTTFEQISAWSHQQRMIKRDDEIKKLYKAVRKGAKAFDAFANFLQAEGVGKSEAYLQYHYQTILTGYGKRDLSFDPIVAIGSNAAKPHAMPTDVKLRQGDLLLVDAGVKYKGYCSDRTRTMAVGDNMHFGYEQIFSKKTQQKVYDTVLKAHDKAIEGARSGMKAKEIDALARNVIEKSAFNDLFIHSTGHGVGLDIHEMPYISAKSNTVIDDNMVFTIEPGIYMPGKFGVRIEDMVVMKNGRAEVMG
jgi:Xaa-Pro aminopeptidase